MRTSERRWFLIALAGAGLWCGVAGAEEGTQRFPPPDFTDHPLPVTATPPGRAQVMEWVDIGVLAAALALAAYLVLRRRSRGGVWLLMLFSLAYFGFYRQGCICPIGAIQNVALAVFDPGYVVPVSAVAFLLLPLATALFFGRVFCAAVCPLGAIQDAVLVRPLKLPRWLEHGLGLLPWAYLGMAVLLAATGAAFVICRYDPFVLFFRFGGSLMMLIFGLAVLVIAMFVGRAYCRFACPLGAMLRPLSRLARWHASITPDECIRCRLCEDACPFNAIDRPAEPPPNLPRSSGKGRLAILIVLLPALVWGGAWLAGRAGGTLARLHPTVQLADGVRQRQQSPAGADVSVAAAAQADAANVIDPVDVFYRTGQPVEPLYQQAEAVESGFRAGGWYLGGFLALVVGGKLIGLSLRRRRDDYEANRSTCVSCARCFRYCPREHVRLKKAAEGGTP